VTRAGEGASVDDTSGARDDGSSIVGKALFRRLDRPIIQECRTMVIGAISPNLVKKEAEQRITRAESDCLL
jgi:hypothetical protein